MIFLKPFEWKRRRSIMIIENIDLNNIRTYTDVRFQLFVGLCEKIGLLQSINNHMKKTTGRPMDIPPGVETMILMASMVEEGYKPLHQLHDYYQSKDFEGVFHYPVELEQIKDDRFRAAVPVILRIFSNILYQYYIHNSKTIRRLIKPLNDSQLKIIRYLEIPESTFSWNGT